MLIHLTLTACLCVPVAQHAVLDTPPFPERTTLVAPDGQPGDQFGSAVAIDGDRAAVGAEFDGTTVGPRSGSVYLYRRDGFGWVFDRKLRASDASNNSRFGLSVALAGDTLVVGSADRLDTTPRAGAVYVFRFDGTDWVEEAKLRASDASAQTYFGTAVAVHGDTLVAGTDKDATGCAYVFRYDGANWLQEARLTASDGAPGDSFGRSVSLFRDTAVVGAPGADHVQSGWPECNAGAVYVFGRSPATGGGAQWTEDAKLVAGDATCQDIFGFAVSLGRERLLVGAPRKDAGGFFRSGTAYVFERSLPSQGSAWSETQRLDGVPGLNVEFGRSVALDERTAAVGALFAPGASAPGAGDTHLFALLGGTWYEQGRFAWSSGAQYDELGGSVALSGATLVSGAAHADPLGNDSGAAFVFDTGTIFPSFCNGTDLAACPCANPGDAKSGCDAPSSKNGVTLEVLGQDVAHGRALLLATGFPSSSLPTAVVVRSATLESPAAFGDGLRCVTLPLTRFSATLASGGASLHPFGHGQGTGTFHYQVWYRSTPLAYCDPGAAYNATNGITLTW